MPYVGVGDTAGVGGAGFPNALEATCTENKMGVEHSSKTWRLPNCERAWAEWSTRGADGVLVESVSTGFGHCAAQFCILPVLQ